MEGRKKWKGNEEGVRGWIEENEKMESESDRGERMRRVGL